MVRVRARVRRSRRRRRRVALLAVLVLVVAAGVALALMAYTLPTPDPKSGYTTRYLQARVGVFAPVDSRFISTTLNGRPFAALPHQPRVASVVDRRFVETTMMLNAGQTGTFDVVYKLKRAADPISKTSKIYSLSADPQGLIVPETLHVNVIWPDGFSPTSPLPAGWSKTSDGASYSGTLADQASWRSRARGAERRPRRPRRGM